MRQEIVRTMERKKNKLWQKKEGSQKDKQEEAQTPQSQS
jgi:hypothetical protein